MIIRRSTPDDGAALLRLAALDSAQPLQGDALLAEVDGELQAAISLTDGRAIADPFRRTTELIELLRMRAEQLTEPRQPRLRARLIPRRAPARA